MAEAIAEAISEVVTKRDLQDALRDLKQRLTIRLSGMMVVPVGIILVGFRAAAARGTKREGPDDPQY